MLLNVLITVPSQVGEAGGKRARRWLARNAAGVKLIRGWSDSEVDLR